VWQLYSKIFPTQNSLLYSPSSSFPILNWKLRNPAIEQNKHHWSSTIDSVLCVSGVIWDGVQNLLFLPTVWPQLIWYDTRCAYIIIYTFKKFIHTIPNLILKTLTSDALFWFYIFYILTFRCPFFRVIYYYIWCIVALYQMWRVMVVCFMSMSNPTYAF